MKRNLIYLVLLSVIVWIASCSDSDDTPTHDFPQNVITDVTQVAGEPGDQFVVKILESNGNNLTVTSSDPTIVTATIVGKDLQIDLLQGGRASIIITDEKGIKSSVGVHIYGDLLLDTYDLELPFSATPHQLSKLAGKVDIVEGNEGYNAVSNDPRITAKIESGAVVVEALGLLAVDEVTTVKVTDLRGKTKTLSVKMGYKTILDDSESRNVYKNTTIKNTGSASIYEYFAEEITPGAYHYGYSRKGTSALSYNIQVWFPGDLTVGLKSPAEFRYGLSMSDRTADNIPLPSVRVLKNDGTKVWIMFCNGNEIGYIVGPAI